MAYYDNKSVGSAFVLGCAILESCCGLNVHYICVYNSIYIMHAHVVYIYIYITTIHTHTHTDASMVLFALHSIHRLGRKCFPPLIQLPPLRVALSFPAKGDRSGMAMRHRMCQSPMDPTTPALADGNGTRTSGWLRHHLLQLPQ